MFQLRPALISFFLIAPAAVALPYSVPEVLALAGPVRTQTISLAKAAVGTPSSLEFSLDELPGPDGRLKIEIVQEGRTLARKTLHAGDADFYTTFRRGSGAAPELKIDASGITGRFRLKVGSWPESTRIKTSNNHTWKDAGPMALGQTIFASNDEVEYIPVQGTARADAITGTRGEDWYKFEFAETRPKLVYFQVELMDRDDLPVDVSIFRERDGKLVEFLDGQDPVSQPHEVQALPGNKFTPRVLKDQGGYHVRVRANHPEYKLRTRIYDAPPYADPQQAVRTAVDYIMGAGDSWFANTPRRGGTLDRVMPVHQETSLCVSCHPAHFSQRAQLEAIGKGYPVEQRQQLAFLEERFYNNPRPFYGFESDGAVWNRVISAPANVLSRMAVITSMFEDRVSGTPRPEYRARIAKYLEIYYSGLTKLPADETNGNTPLVSAFEVGWYSWKTLKSANPASDLVARLPAMLAEAPVKNMVDLCYQTLALAEIDKTKYAETIKANAERLLTLQREDGQWSMRFDPKEAEVEFQTGHVLWTLANAGIPKEEPHVAKAITYLMKRQQAFGGWMDPLQTYENFKTPFRETQFAILALSAYFPAGGRPNGWGMAPVAKLSADPVELLDQLDRIWDRPAPAVVKEIESALGSNDALIRQAAAEALGRLAMPGSVVPLLKALGDSSKMVQRTAAWSLRQIYSAHADLPAAPLATALKSPVQRVRWGAARVFAHHFSELSRKPELLDAVAGLSADAAPAIRLQAVRALWQGWFWTPDATLRGRIEDTIIAGLKKPQHPWVETNIQAAVYNLADDNIRYLYNNWVALLPNAVDRDRATKGRLEIESRLAEKFCNFLGNATDEQKKRLLAALVEMPQRRGDIYDLDSDLSKPVPPIYNRLGNDIEQIAFFGTTATKWSKAIRPLVDSPDAEMRGLALKATLLVRETPFPETEKIAGGRSDEVRDLGKKISAMPAASEVSTAFYYRQNQPKPPVGAAATAAKLDEAVFHEKVEPLFKEKGPDGYACVNCHATHTLFNGTWATVANVIDPKQPENSLLLRKPTSTAESEGVVNARTTAHGGGQRWAVASPEYNAILEWLRGTKK